MRLQVTCVYMWVWVCVRCSGLTCFAVCVFSAVRARKSIEEALPGIGSVDVDLELDET